jgi:hypothetical protein
MNDGPFERREELRIRFGRDRADGAAGHQKPEGMDRIGGIGHEHDIARTRDGLRHIGEALL